MTSRRCPRTRSSSRWPTRTPRSSPRMPLPTSGSWRRDGRTTRTRSTTPWSSQGSPAGPAVRTRKSTSRSGGGVVNPLIFRKYDIRGRVGEDLTPETVVSIGKGFGTYAAREGGKSLMVGRDCRLSSPSFRAALVEGLLSAGMDVVDVGICPTPLLYFSILRFGADGGVMVTGSHNPPEFNGFKLCVGPANPCREKTREIRRIIERGGFVSGERT